jgi:hypothetical protein
VKLFTMIEAFRNDEAGAVTVDWVVLTAAIVGLGLAVIASVRNGATSLASGIQSSLSGATVNSIGTVGFSN